MLYHKNIKYKWLDSVVTKLLNINENIVFQFCKTSDLHENIDEINLNVLLKVAIFIFNRNNVNFYHIISWFILFYSRTFHNTHLFHIYIHNVDHCTLVTWKCQRLFYCKFLYWIKKKTHKLITCAHFYF